MSCTELPKDPPPPPPGGGGGGGGGGGFGSFFVGISAFGEIGCSPDTVWQGDFRAFATDKVSVVRIWFDWDGKKETHPDMRAVQTNGTLNAGIVDRLKRILTGGAAANIRFDLTSHGVGAVGAFDSPDAWFQGNVALANALKSFTNILFWDVCNEFEGGGLSTVELVTGITAVKSLLPNAKVSASVSGDTTLISQSYATLIGAGAKVDVLMPHFQRDADGSWASKLPGRISTVRNNLAAVGIVKPIYCQEEARKHEDEAWNPVLAFQSCSGAKSAGAVGWTFHTDAGFDTYGADPLWGHMDDDEKSAIAECGGIAG